MSPTRFPVRFLRRLIWCYSAGGWNFTLDWRPTDGPESRWHASIWGLAHILPSTSFSLMLTGVGIWSLSDKPSIAEQQYGAVMLAIGIAWLALNVLRAFASTRVVYSPSTGELALERRIAGITTTRTACPLKDVEIGYALVSFLGLVSGKPVEVIRAVWPNGEATLLSAGGSSEARYASMPFADQKRPIAHRPMTTSKYVVF